MLNGKREQKTCLVPYHKGDRITHPHPRTNVTDILDSICLFGQRGERKRPRYTSTDTSRRDTYKGTFLGACSLQEKKCFENRPTIVGCYLAYYTGRGKEKP